MRLTDDLLAHLQRSHLEQIARQLAVDPATASQAISAAVPMLVQALGTTASQPQGAQAVLTALVSCPSNPNLGDAPTLLQTGHTDTSAINAIGLFGNIVDGNQDREGNLLSQATGLGRERSLLLQEILVPLVLDHLAKRLSHLNQPSVSALAPLLEEDLKQMRKPPIRGPRNCHDTGVSGAGNLIRRGSGLLGTGKR